MEVAIGSTSGPFQREVREWQHVDPNTGALLSSRIEADRWIDGPLNKYGKVIDSKNITTPNGIQHSQRKQLEILKAHSSSGSLQVVRAQTVQTSSSRWSSATSSSTTSKAGSFLHPSSNNTKAIEYYGSSNNSFNSDSNNSSSTSNYMNNIVSIPHMAGNHSINNNNNNNCISNNFTSLFQQDEQLNETMSSLNKKINDVQMNTEQQQQHVVLRPTEISTISNVGGGVVSRKSAKTATTLTTTTTAPQNHLYHELNERENLLNHNHHISNNTNSSHSTNLARGKSVSNEDISIENHPDINLDENGEPIEWKRVSKIRRSLQYPKSSTTPTVTLRHSTYSRPPDLPENSVSVQRIKQELENGRRLSTVMRNNHIDLVALENILNGGDSVKQRDSKSLSPSSSTSDKRSSFITAESLKEIRGKLRKLSDESLYKDDMSQRDDVKVDSGSGLVDRLAVKIAEPVPIKQDSLQVTSGVSSSRSKYKNLSSNNDWYLRRKSYGFEKMLPQSDSSSKMLESTDSGIGRSSEMSNWSSNDSPVKGGTVIALNDTNSSKTKTSSSSMSITFTNGAHEIKHSYSRHQAMNLLSNGVNYEDEIKRHSIAVDEAKYVRDNLRRVFDSKTSIHLNGMYSDDSSSQANNSGDDNRDSRKNAKRVEFCKTEVHFAAESGRVNIVETDGKPPPTNNFRRRRRISSGGSSAISASYLGAINSGVPVTHFGDPDKKGVSTAGDTATGDIISTTGTVTSLLTTNSTSTISSAAGVIMAATPSQKKELDEMVAEHDDENTLIRGILKNKPIKPRPYHLGDNIENSESLWGVRLRPVSNDFTIWRLSSICNDDDETNEISSSPPSSSSSLNKQQQQQQQINNNSNSISDNSNNSNNVNSNNCSGSNNDRDKTNSITNQNESTTSMNLGYSTKVNLSSNPSSFSWNNKDKPNQQQQSQDNQKVTVKLRGNEKNTPPSKSVMAKPAATDEKETTKISIDMSTASSSSSPTTADLKSTSLIMQTIRSSGHFDDLIKNLEYGTDKFNRLSIDDEQSINRSKLEGASQPTSALKLISQMNAITKSNSANSLLKDTSKLSLYDSNSVACRGKKYSSSLDGGDHNREYDSELDSFDSTKLYAARKHSLQSKIEENYKIISNYSNSSFSSCCSEKYDYAASEFGDEKKPIAAPRMKKIGPTNVLSQQLSQLRRLYEAADQDSDDSAKADEEVKHYLGNLISMEERTSELSGSWSRVKAKRSVMKQNTKDEETKSLESGKEKAKEYKYSTGHKDMIHSNVMSIALHSPISQKRSSSPIPIAKPRSVVAPVTTKTMITSTPVASATKQPQPQHHQQQQQHQQHQTVVRKLNPNEKDGDRNSLKLSSGPRKLREHELSYFGVSVPKSGSNSLQTTPNNTINNKTPLTSTTTVLSGSKNLSTAKLNNTNSSNNDNFLKKWQLTHDKPDLLRHSPNNNTNNGDYTPIKSSSSTSSVMTTTSSSSLVKMNLNNTNLNQQQTPLANDEPVYENIRKIGGGKNRYERKHDLKRDEMILNELSKTADQILSSISGYTDDDSNEENKKISANLKKSANLHTIDEHKSVGRHHHQKTMHSKAVQVSTPVYSNSNSSSLRHKTSPDSRQSRGHGHHAHHHSHRSARGISSASSNESIPRVVRSSSRPLTTTTATQKTKRLCHKHHEQQQNADLRSGGSMGSVKSITRRKASDRMHRTSSRDTLNSNNASSSEDLQSSVEIPRRPRRIRAKEKGESHQTVSAKKNETKSSTMRSGSAEKTLSSHRNTIRSTSSSLHRNDHGGAIKDNKGSILIEQQQKHRIKSGVVTTTPSSSAERSSKRGTIRSSEKVWK